MPINKVSSTNNDQIDHIPIVVSDGNDTKNQIISTLASKAIKKPNGILSACRWTISHIKDFFSNLGAKISHLFNHVILKKHQSPSIPKLQPTQPVTSISTIKSEVTATDSKGSILSLSKPNHSSSLNDEPKINIDNNNMTIIKADEYKSPEIKEKLLGEIKNLRKIDDSNPEIEQVIVDMEIYAFDLMDQADVMIESLRIYFEILTKSAENVDLRKVNSVKIQNLFALGQEIEEYYEIVVDILNQSSKNERIEKVLKPMIEGLLNSKNKLKDNIIKHRPQIEVLVGKELDGIQQRSTLLPHEKIMISELSRDLGLFTAIFSPDLFARAKKMKKTIKDSVDTSSSKNNIDQPVGFQNLGNSCYMNSTLQALFSSPFLLNLANTPLQKYPDESPSHFSLRSQLWTPLNALIKAMKAPGKKIKNGIKDTVLANALNDLRIAMCRSGLNQDINEHTMFNQHDAAQFALLITEVLGAQFTMREWRVFSHQDVELKTKPNNQLESMFQVEFKEGVRGDQDLQAMVNSTLIDKVDNADGYQPEIENTKYLVSSYTTRRVFSLPPQSFFIEVKRHAMSVEGDSYKNETLLRIPQNQILDFSHASENEPLQYRIIGYVRHIAFERDELGRASLDGGHYVSYVKHGGKWYECNDISINEINENDIPKSEAYLLMLDRI